MFQLVFKNALLSTVDTFRILKESRDEVVEEVIEVHLGHFEDAADDLVLEQVMGAVDQHLKQNCQEVDRQVLRENWLAGERES